MRIDSPKPSYLLVVAALFTSSCQKESTTEELSDDFVGKIYAVGYVEPKDGLRRLAFGSHGVIETIECEIGERVSAGQILARLDAELETSEVEIARAKLTQAKASRRVLLAGAHPDSIREAEESAELAQVEASHLENERARLERLVQTSSVSENAYERAQFEAEAASRRWQRTTAALSRLNNRVRPVDVQHADAEVELALAELKAAERRLQRRFLKAPGDGIILEKFLREGESISLSFSEPVLLFAPSGPLEIRAEIDESFVEELTEGAFARIYSHLGKEAVTGTVQSVKAVMGRKTVFTGQATERLDLQVLEARIALNKEISWPIGYEVEVDIQPILNSE